MEVYDKELSFPISLGILPVNSFKRKDKFTKSVSNPISVGILPVNWLVPTVM
jgi:5,10-methylenetetrahydrofolate reductase